MSDKEGGFVVCHSQQYHLSAESALKENFKVADGFNPSKTKKFALGRREESGLEKLSSAMKRSKEMCLSAFFTVKTHKIGNPCRVMVSEVGTWQKCLGSYLLEGLRQLPINDPFLVRNSTEVTSS